MHVQNNYNWFRVLFIHASNAFAQNTPCDSVSVRPFVCAQRMYVRTCERI